MYMYVNLYYVQCAGYNVVYLVSYAHNAAHDTLTRLVVDNVSPSQLNNCCVHGYAKIDMAKETYLRVISQVDLS